MLSANSLPQFPGAEVGTEYEQWKGGCPPPPHALGILDPLPLPSRPFPQPQEKGMFIWKAKTGLPRDEAQVWDGGRSSMEGAENRDPRGRETGLRS